jgi:hypothetical protein
MPISQSNNHRNLKQERITPLLLPTFSHLFTLSAKSPTCDYPDTDLHLTLRAFLSNAQHVCQVLKIPQQEKEKYLLKKWRALHHLATLYCLMALTGAAVLCGGRVNVTDWPCGRPAAFPAWNCCNC